MSIFCALALTFFVCYSVIRWLWLYYILYCWRQVCDTYYMIHYGEFGQQDYDRYIKVWPQWSILTYFWVWDFRRFIVNQTDMENILDYFAQGRKVMDENLDNNES